jgi:hypothetical protein
VPPSSAFLCAAPRSRAAPRRTAARAAAAGAPEPALAGGVPPLPTALPPPRSAGATSAEAALPVLYKAAAASLALIGAQLAIAPELALALALAQPAADLASPHVLLLGRIWVRFRRAWTEHSSGMADARVCCAQGAGFIPASVACASLAEAAVHARLSSDTYKRLNIGLVRACLGYIGGVSA